MTAVNPERRRGIETVDLRLQQTRQHAARAQRDLYARMNAELKTVKRTARTAQRRAENLERRAERAERKLADLRASRTWRVGRAVLWFPATLRRVMRVRRG